MDGKIRHCGIVVIALLLAGSSIGCESRQSSAETTPEIRIGTYNSQSVALAYGRSKLFTDEVALMFEQHKQAKAAGDIARVAELEAAGKARQERIHQQVFESAPIDDVLAIISDDLVRIAREAKVESIVAEGGCEGEGPAAEFVDVTDAMIMLFEPTDKTLEFIEQIRRRGPTRHGKP